MRHEFEMTEAQLAKLLDACKPVPYIALQCGTPPFPQENANRAWKALGSEMGFDGVTVLPVRGRGQRFFTAVVTEPPSPPPVCAEARARFGPPSAWFGEHVLTCPTCREGRA